jgi:hypothetical protein
LNEEEEVPARRNIQFLVDIFHKVRHNESQPQVSPSVHYQDAVYQQGVRGPSKISIGLYDQFSGRHIPHHYRSDVIRG